MTRTVLFALVLAACGKSEQSPPPPPVETKPPAPPTPPAPPPVDRAELLAGKLPDADPTTELVNAQCRICHGTDYLTQQRLGEAAWKKTIDKMRKFGANLSDEEAAAVIAYGVRYWNADLPERSWPTVAPPQGALP